MSECDESIIYQMGYNKGFGDGIKGSFPKSVLEDIKAELEDFLYHNALISPDHYDEVLAILDKHISRKEQDDGTDKRMFSK